MKSLAAIRIIIGAAALAVPLSPSFATPQPGDVFAEIGWKIDRTLQGDGANSGPIPVPAKIDLDHATRAEAVIEYANVHLGVNGLALQVNEHDGIPVPFPESVPALPCPAHPAGDRSHIYQMPVVTVPVPLSDLTAGLSNTVSFMTPDKGENRKAFTQVYGVTLRIYYDPARTAHASGEITSPVSGSPIGLSARLEVNTKGDVARVEYVGFYEDIDYNGDGVYLDWVQSRRYGSLTNVLASSATAPFSASWDTTWVPDQAQPILIAARIADANGLIYFTQPATNLSLLRPGYSVRLCKPEGVLNGFSTCTYGMPDYIYTADVKNKTETFHLDAPQGEIADARLFFACWRRRSAPEIDLNGKRLEGISVEGMGSQYITAPLRPLDALQTGKNTLVLVNARDGGTDIEWPGVQVLVRYRARP